MVVRAPIIDVAIADVVIKLFILFSQDEFAMNMQELAKILKSKYVIEHTMTQMKFWDSVKNKIQNQKSYIHKIVLQK